MYLPLKIAQTMAQVGKLTRKIRNVCLFFVFSIAFVSPLMISPS
jgi:hypothetical protein